MTRLPSQTDLRDRRSKWTKRRGFAALELALTLPVLGLILMGLVEFSMLIYARSSVVQACRYGARAASLAGVPHEQIEWEIRNTLPPALQDGLDIEVIGGDNTGDVVTVILGVPMSAASPDLLWPIGYSLDGRYLISETSMIKE